MRISNKISVLLETCGSLSSVWETVGTSCGLTEPQITAFQTAAAAADEAVGEQFKAREAAKSSTVTANTSVKALRESLAGAIRSIDTFALAQPDPAAIWAMAQIPAPKPRTASEPPGQPFDITAELDSDGNVTLKWKCTNPPGGNVVYTVARSFSPTGTFTQVGVSGRRRFTDGTIPGGSPVVCYQVRGLRGQTVGQNSAVFTLRFGQGGGGLFIASQGETSGKLAA
jgi:hypothetical protein